MQVSKEIVPFDTGALQDTGRTKLTVQNANRVEVALSYGGFSHHVGKWVDYAVIVHERVDMDKSPKRAQSGRRSKFLEIPLKREVGNIGFLILHTLDRTAGLVFGSPIQQMRLRTTEFKPRR